MGQNQNIQSTPVSSVQSIPVQSIPVQSTSVSSVQPTSQPCVEKPCVEKPCVEKPCAEVPCKEVIDKKSNIIITEASFGANIDSKYNNNLKDFFEKFGRLQPNIAKIDHKDIKNELNRLIKLNNFPSVGIIPKINLIIDFVGMSNNYNVTLRRDKRKDDKESNILNLDKILISDGGEEKSVGMFMDLNDVIDIFNVKDIIIINGCLKLLNIPANFFVVHDLTIIGNNKTIIEFKQSVPDELKPIFENIKIIGESEPKKETFENIDDNNYIFIIAIIIILCFLLYNKK